MKAGLFLLISQSMKGREDVEKVLDLAIQTTENVIKVNELTGDNVVMLEINILYYLFDLFKARREDDMKEIYRAFEIIEARDAGEFLAKQRKFYLN